MIQPSTTQQNVSNKAVRVHTDRVGVAVVGCGYWGPNLIRNFSACPKTEMVAICDLDARRLEKAAGLCQQAYPTSDFDAVLADEDIAAVAVATPPKTHAALAERALQAGKHVLIEKPMATTEAEARRLIELAQRNGRILMTDHTYIYSPAIRKIKSLIDGNELGEIYFIDSVRINLGLFQNDVNVMWDLAVHDLSIVDYILGRQPCGLSAIGSSHTRSGIENIAHLNLDYGGGLLATFHVNWLSPVKVRHLIVGGSKKSIVFNDLDLSEPLKIYDRGINVQPCDEARHGVLISYRMGDVWSPNLPREEPLQNMVAHFAECILTGQQPLSGGEAGLHVVRILESADRSIKSNGERITLAT